VNLFLIRHGESTANSGEDDCVDAGLSARGIEQARELAGQFGLAVLSPLRRARQTWELSSMQADYVVIEPACRERVVHPRDALPGELFRAETDDEFWQRVASFKAQLEAWSATYGSIVIIGHSYFFAAAFNAWGMANCELRRIW
jgi:broad specificity phosphatase PhoE